MTSNTLKVESIDNKIRQTTIKGALVQTVVRQDILGIHGPEGPAGPAAPQVDSPNGASMLLGIAEEELTLSGPSVTSTVFIPTRSIIQGVSTYTSDTITGASSYDCGYAASGSEFGGGLGISIGANNVGVIGPTAVYSDTTITLTANGSDFTGGKVRVALQYIQLTPPTS